MEAKRLLLAVIAGLLLSAPTAQAGRPLDVDCDLLEATNDAVNVFLDGEGVRAQPGGFYGGWITKELVGPFKGEPGTEGW